MSNVEIDASLDFETNDTDISTALLDSSLSDLEALRTRSAGRTTSNHATEPRSTSALPSVPATLNLEPLQPARLRPAKEKANCDSKQLESGEAVGRHRADMSADDGVHNASGSSTPSDGYQTPMQGGSPQREAVSLPQRLTYDMSVTSGPDPSRSYVIHGESNDFTIDSQDTDSNKLQTSGSGKAVLQSVLKSDSDAGERTSFAKLRKWKERNSGSLESPVIYDQRGSAPSTMSKSVYVVHPAQTTWMEAARIQRSASDRQVCRPAAETCDGGLAPSQMAGLKMKLEEKRRMIQSGKRKVEKQCSQQQQQVGEEAFLQIIRRQPVRQPDSSLLQKNISPLSGSNVRSASTGRYHTAADSNVSSSMLTQQQIVNKDAAVVRPSKGITQPVLSGALLSKARDDAKVAHGQTYTRSAHTVTQPVSAMAQQASQSDVVDAASQDSKSQIRASAAGLASADKAGQLEAPQGMSFDRLSSSLSDLQAEIVRLTQQQDEIKHLVSGTGNGTTAAEHTPFFLYPTSGNSVSAAPNAAQTASAGAVIPPPSTRPPQPYPAPSGYPVDPRLYIPEYGTFPPHYPSHHHVASSLPHANAMYPLSGVPPVTHRYPGGGPYMAPYPHDPMSGMYRSPGMPPTAASDVYPVQWPPGQTPQSYYMSAPYVDHVRHNVPAGGSTFSHAVPSVPPHAMSMQSHSSREPSAPQTVVAGSLPSPPQAVLRDVPVSQPQAFFISTSSSSEPAVGKPNVTSPSEAELPVATTLAAVTPVTPVTLATAFFIDTSTIADASPQPHSSPPSHVTSQTPPVSTTPHTSAFFVSTSPTVDSSPPRDSKQLVSLPESELQHSPVTDNVAAVQENVDLQPSVSDEPSTAGMTGTSSVLPPDAPAPSADTKTPVVFVIGQNDEVCHSPGNELLRIYAIVSWLKCIMLGLSVLLKF